jgi:transposase
VGSLARSKRIARIVGMNDLDNHYRMLLGLDEAWLVKSVDLSMESKRVVIALAHRGGRLTCPACGISCTQADLAP